MACESLIDQISPLTQGIDQVGENRAKKEIGDNNKPKADAEKRNARFQIGLEHGRPRMPVEITEGGAVTIDDRDWMSPVQEKAGLAPCTTRQVENCCLMGN